MANAQPKSRTAALGRFLYIFLDEAGDFAFRPQGTSHFILTSITKERPFTVDQPLTDLKYDLVQSGVEIEYFHASEDRQPVRNQVFEIIKNNLQGIRIDSLIVEKRKTGPALQIPEKFYPKMLGYLLKYVLGQFPLADFSDVLIFTDRIPINRKRQAVAKAIKITLADMLPAGTAYKIFHHESKSNFNLQIVDYCNWAIYRKWKGGDKRSYDLIKTAIRSEFDIFRRGKVYYY